MNVGLTLSQPVGLTGGRCFRHSAACRIIRQSAGQCLRQATVQQMKRPLACSARQGSSARRCLQPVAASTAGAVAAPQCSSPQPVQARAVAMAVGMWQAVVSMLATVAKRFNQPLEPEEAGKVNSGMSRTFRTMRQLAVIMPLASSGSTAYLMLIITRAMASFVKLYLLLLFIRVLLSWFPTFNWDKHPWLALRQLTDPYLNIFRGIVPPLMGTMDFTPLFGFMILQFLGGALDFDDNEALWK